MIQLSLRLVFVLGAEPVVVQLSFVGAEVRFDVLSDSIQGFEEGICFGYGSQGAGSAGVAFGLAFLGGAVVSHPGDGSDHVLWHDGVVGYLPLGVHDVLAGSFPGFFDLGAGSSEGLVVGVSGSVDESLYTCLCEVGFLLLWLV